MVRTRSGEDQAAREGPGGVAIVLAACGAIMLAACGGEKGPPPTVAHEDAGTQIRRVATRWGDTIEDDGFLQNDPNGVVQFHVVTKRELTLEKGGAASLHVERTEAFKTKLGDFHCTAAGDLKGVASYAWQSGEAEVKVELPAGRLPRDCKEAGFPVTAKALDASVMLLLLRDDRLIGKASALDRTVLLPLQ